MLSTVSENTNISQNHIPHVISASGNGVGLDQDSLTALPADDRAQRIRAADRALREAGAHYVIESVAQLGPVLAEIEARIARGERP